MCQRISPSWRTKQYNSAPPKAAVFTRESARYMHDLANQALDAATAAGASYADVRVIEQESQHLGTKDQTVSQLDLGASSGIGIRVLYNGGWGFASTQHRTKKAITAAARRAVETARASA